MIKIMNNHKICLSGIILFCIGLLLCPHAWAKKPIKLSIAVYRTDGNYFAKPMGRNIHITEQPIPFKLIFKNISRSTRKVWQYDKDNLYKYFYFEITDENNQTQTIHSSANYGYSGSATKVLLDPGEELEMEISIDPDEWQGFPVLEEGKIKKFGVRVVYESKNEKISSDVYNVVLGEE